MDQTSAPLTELYDRLVERSNRPGHFTSDLGLTVTAVRKFVAEGTITPDAHACNPRGIIHGGALYTIMDHLSGLAACSTGRGCVTLDTSVNYLRSVPAGRELFCTAEVVKPGSNVTVVSARVYTGDGKTICSGSFTYFMLEPLTDTLTLCDQVTNHR